MGFFFFLYTVCQAPVSARYRQTASYTHTGSSFYTVPDLLL